MRSAYLASLTLALGMAGTVATAQVTVNGGGAAPSVVVGVPGSVVTVDGYKTRLREGYVSAGLPDTIIEQVLPIDVEIYNARLAGDTDKVRFLRQRQAEIVTPGYLPKVRTYFVAHPYVVTIGGQPFTVWMEETVDSDGEIVSVPVYEQRMRVAYAEAGLPETVIVQLIPIDLEIYNAYGSGNVTSVAELQERERRLLPAEHAGKVTTYFREHPIRLKTKANTTFVPWHNPTETVGKGTGAPAPKTDPAQPDKSKTIPIGVKIRAIVLFLLTMVGTSVLFVESCLVVRDWPRMRPPSPARRRELLVLASTRPSGTATTRYGCTRFSCSR